MFGFKDDDLLALDAHEDKLMGIDVNHMRRIVENNVESRGVVFSLCSNTLDSIKGYVAFLESRKLIPVMLDYSMDKALLDSLIETYKPEYFWCPKAKQSNLNLDVDRLFESGDYLLLKNKAGVKVPVNENLALLLTTSGSTGSPKLVRLTYDNIKSNAIAIAEYLGITEVERPITTLPMHYSYGLSVINSHLLKKAVILVTDKSIVEKDFWNFFISKEATSISGVPYTYHIIKQFRLLRRKLPSLKTLTQAGGKLSQEMVSEFAQWAADNGCRFFVMYGQTEATARMSYLPYDKALSKSASIGIPIPGGAFRVVDIDDNPVTKPGVPGELVYEGPNVSMGYAENISDLSKGDNNNGCLKTGDIAEFDVDGYYYIVGRLKRFIKIFGNRVNLDMAEQLVRQITDDCACTGTDDKLIVYIVDGRFKDDVINHIALKTGLHISAIEVRVVDDIPKNSSGKIQYSQLLES